jgi:putative transposase
LEYSIALLQEHLTFLQHTGTQWQTDAIWRVLLSAAVQATSIEAACADWECAPDSNTVRLILRTCVDNARFDLIEQSVNEALLGHLPRWLRRGAVEVAFDVHEEPYYGRVASEAEFICRGEAQRGTTRFYRCVTVYVLRRGVRLTLAVKFLRKADNLPAVVQALYQRLTTAGVHLRRAYFDKGFRSVELLQFLQKVGVAAILATPLNDGARGVKALCHGRRSYRTTHTFVNPQAGRVTVPVCLVRTWELRKGKRMYRWLAFVALRCRAAPYTVRTLYRRRFGIESSYRLMEHVRVRTSSPCSAWHFLFMGLALILVNAWNCLQWRYTTNRTPRAHQLDEARLRLHRFVRFILMAVDLHFHLRTVLPITQIGKY